MSLPPKPWTHFSQDSLYFPLPLRDIIIENIVQVKNLLQKTDNNNDNIIAFKALCTVRNRYNVRPSVGFILPTESVKIRFLLDVPQIRRQISQEKKGSSDVVMPDANTNDFILMDIAILSRDEAARYTAVSNGKQTSAEDGSSGVHREDATAFWKSRGKLKSGDVKIERRKLNCIYEEKGVPDSLVMRISGERAGTANNCQQRNIGAGSPLAVPKSRPKLQSTDVTRRSPPAAPPRVSPPPSTVNYDGLESPRATATAGNSCGSIPRNANAAMQQQPPPPEQQPLPLTAAPPAHALIGNEPVLWRDILFFKVSFPALALLLVLTFMCALFEKGTLLSWLLIGE